MNCAWDAYLKLLPNWISEFVDKYGRNSLEELRLRKGRSPELIFGCGSLLMDRPACNDDLTYVINASSRYSPWAATTCKAGYITAEGGHRIGVCGEVNMRDAAVWGIPRPHYLCLRVARDYVGIATEIAKLNGSMLLIGPPGSGKTTMLRDLVRQLSYMEKRSVCVVDERGEIFPLAKEGSFFDAGPRTDVLSGCDKSTGIEMVLRAMGPSVIALDEITAKKDCDALIYAGWCGIRLLATAHAASKSDLYSRPVYRPLVEAGLFDYLIILQPDKSWTYERIGNVH